jgi:uncharacterized protein (DUF2147 family)
MKFLSLLFCATLISFSGFTQNKDAILGKWLNSSGEAQVEIYKKGTQYAGKIVWLKNPNDDNGKAKRDLNNPKINQQYKPLLGLELLNGFVYDDGKWTDGKIYDPKSGKTYSCNITQKNSAELNIRGYVGISLIGRTDVWKRVK